MSSRLSGDWKELAMTTTTSAVRAGHRSAVFILRIFVVVLTLTTAAIHARLGGLLFTLNALGYLGLAAAMVLPGPVARVRWLVRIALIGFTRRRSAAGCYSGSIRSHISTRQSRWCYSSSCLRSGSMVAGRDRPSPPAGRCLMRDQERGATGFGETTSGDRTGSAVFLLGCETSEGRARRRRFLRGRRDHGQLSAFDRTELLSGRPVFGLLFFNRVQHHNVTSSARPLAGRSSSGVFSGQVAAVRYAIPLATTRSVAACPEMQQPSPHSEPADVVSGTPPPNGVGRHHLPTIRSEAPAVAHRIIQLARLAIVPALLALGTVSAPAVLAGNPCFHGFELPPASVGSSTDVNLMPCAFEPTITKVAQGAEVTFINGPDFTHLITGANQAWVHRTSVQPGTSVS
jgi:hypothetical protein